MYSKLRRETQQLIDEREKRERRIVLIGKSGHGKSTTGNRLCARKAFLTSPGAASFTKRSCPAERKFGDLDITICDTPGLFDTKDDLSVIKSEMARAVLITSPGVHAFLIHFKITNRFTDEEKKTIEYIQDIFGKDAHKFCILVLTGGDNLDADQTTVDEYLQTAESGLKKLLEQCHHRYIVINNRAKQEEIDEKLRQLLEIIETMLSENQTRYYTNKQFQKAEQELQEQEKKRIEDEIQKKEADEKVLREKISQEFEEREKRFQKEKEELEKLVKGLRKQARDEASAQQNTSLLATVCKAIPDVITAVIPMVTSLVQTNGGPEQIAGSLGIQPQGPMPQSGHHHFGSQPHFHTHTHTK